MQKITWRSYRHGVVSWTQPPLIFFPVLGVLSLQLSWSFNGYLADYLLNHDLKKVSGTFLHDPNNISEKTLSGLTFLCCFWTFLVIMQGSWSGIKQISSVNYWRDFCKISWINWYKSPSVESQRISFGTFLAIAWCKI